jgi:hypothetical protein
MNEKGGIARRETRTSVAKKGTTEAFNRRNLATGKHDWWQVRVVKVDGKINH